MVVKDWKIWNRYKDGSVIFIKNNIKKDNIEVTKVQHSRAFPNLKRWAISINGNAKTSFDKRSSALKFAKTYMRKN